MNGELPGEITIVPAGDIVLNRKLSAYSDDGFTQIIEQIQQGDVSIGNLETLLHDFEGYPAPKTGTYMRAPPWVADELAWAGFDMLSTANNHMGDYSHGGMEATIRELEERNFPFAGLGMHLRDARAPAYVDTNAGRVGLVAATSHFPSGIEAGRARQDVQGRPGISPLRLNTQYNVSAESLEALHTISEELGVAEITDHSPGTYGSAPGEETQSFTFPNMGEGEDLSFQCAQSPRIQRTVRDDDRQEILAQVEAASRQADWVVASLHTTAGKNGYSRHHSVPEFLEQFARDCIDAGADAFVSHGPHLLRGIQIYDGAPIFYSLGNFIWQNRTIPRLPDKIYEIYNLDSEATPADLYDYREAGGYFPDRAYWQSVLPVCHFEEGEVRTIELYPVELGQERSRAQQGRPVLATGDEATEILTRMDTLSDAYGTTVEQEGDRGVIYND